MTPEPLHKTFIGFSLYLKDYAKVQNLLPTASYKNISSNQYNKRVTLIYQIEGFIISPNQYRWISNIKLGLEKFIFTPFEFEDEFYIHDTTIITNHIYIIEELSKAFNAPLVIYPKFMYASTKKEVYRNLCRYGKRLIHKQCFTLEAVIVTALLMNRKLQDKLNHKDLIKGAVRAYTFIYKNRDKFDVELSPFELKKAHSKGGKMRKKQRVINTQNRVNELIKNGEYLKPNGKVNLTALAKDMQMTRKTIAKYIK